jgi:hypothetical protein
MQVHFPDRVSAQDKQPRKPPDAGVAGWNLWDGHFSAVDPLHAFSVCES